MSSRTPQLRQSFLVTGAAVALALVTGFALLSSRSASRIVERQANARGQDLATHVASLVDLYLRERRHEAEALAGSPAVVRAALEASQAALRQRLPQLDIPTLERMFNQRRELGGDPDLATYLRGYAQHSDFAELFFTDSHGYNVLASDRTSDFVQSDEAWWQQAVKTGAYEGAPRYDSSAAVVSLEYDIAIRAPRVAHPVGVLKAVFALARLSQLLAAGDLPGGVRLEVVDAQGRRIVTPDSAELLRPLPQAADIPRQSRPATARVVGPGGSADLVITVPTTNGKWWVVFREPERAAYAVARTTATNIVLWTVALFGAALTLLVVFWRRLNRRVTEPVKAAGAIASRVAGGDLSVTVVTERTEGAAEADALARASADIQKFVAQAKAVATQTNMLALNAAIEAARAGPQGRGFAVVADEVRKLASVAAAAATDTADTVRGVLGRVQATRDRLAHLAQGAGVAREAAQTAAQGLGTVAAEAEANDVWSREIANMAGEMRRLVEEIGARLNSVAEGTENLLASAEEIAASSEEQSASTEEIASSANQLAEAADKLTGAVKSFRLLADEAPPQREAAD